MIVGIESPGGWETVYFGVTWPMWFDDSGDDVELIEGEQ